MTDLGSRNTISPAPIFRSYPAQFEVRGLANSQVELQGYATTYDQPYEMFDMFGSYNEVARSGMCAKTIADGADVAYLANHTGLTMARTRSGNLQLSEDSAGLMTVATVNTARSDVRDLVTAIEDGDVDQMSFAFRVVRQQWSPDYDQRDLVEVNLDRGDVSAVNFGANPTTSVSVAQRAFRSVKAARLHRMAVELRAGKALSSQTMDVLSQVLDLIAAADDAVDQAQPLLAELMGVPNPDADDSDAQQNAAYLDLLVRKHLHEARTIHIG
jgi:HK97 family phage prohead protease